MAAVKPSLGSLVSIIQKPVRIFPAGLLLLMAFVTPAWGDQQDSNDIMTQMKTQLDLQQDQVTNITPIIEKYADEFQDLQKSISDGTINPSAIDSQRQGIEAQETQELSQYLKPYQLSEWRDMQAQMDAPKDKDSDTDQSTDTNSDADEYSNLPHNTPPQN